ncbi:MAG: flagellar biosynthesis anti-sigma factor FlgM [Nitrospiraceae bacterium]
MEISKQGRIDDLGKVLLGTQPSARAAAKTAYGTPDKTTDRVEISQAAKDLQRVRSLAQTESPDRADKVDALKQAVESGTYTVSGRTVSNKLLTNTLLDSVL